MAGGDSNFTFADNKDSLRVLENPTRISVEINNIKEKKSYDYQVTLSIEENDTIIKVSSEVVE